MNQSKRVVLLLGVFFAGCAAERVASRHFVPSAHAEEPVRRWEYACKRADDDITNMANQFGAEGWELTAAWGRIWCFKRPAQ
jgi:hypothetical protein